MYPFFLSAIKRSTAVSRLNAVVHPRLLHRFVACGLIGLAGACAAQSVSLSGSMGARALLVIDGNPPKTLAAGDTYLGVRLISSANGEAVVEIKGQRQTLRVGEAPVTVGAISLGSSGKIVLHAQEGGHFFTQGSINGHATQFVVDTGATTVALSVAEAERMGLSYKGGQAVNLSTANGVTRGWLLKLSSVRIGDVELHEVDATVSPQAMPFVLLGNSFLTRFQMLRQNDVMTLERRY